MELAELPPTFGGYAAATGTRPPLQEESVMLRKLSQRINNEEKGFTLIELLVVILIIGILAAIALPAFLGQQSKGQDADAKSSARNMVSQVESCFATNEDYTNCTDANLPTTTTGLPVGTAKGQVHVSNQSATGYVVTAWSKSGSDYVITKDPTTGAVTRSCLLHGGAAGSANNKGGCKNDGTW
jgi:type IV pilus assembly protein PilA